MIDPERSHRQAARRRWQHLMEMARAFRDNPILEKQLARLLYLSPEITRAAYLWLADDYQETVIGLLESARHPGR